MSSLTLLSDRRAREHASQATPRLQARGPVASARMSGASGLSGLTVDERGVHKILIDSLKRVNRAEDIAFGLTRAEKEHLTEALDISFLDAGIARLIHKRTFDVLSFRLSQAGSALGLVIGLALFVVALVTGWEMIFQITVVTFLMAGAFVYSLLKQTSFDEPSERQQIYESLRQLALLIDSGATPDSEALLQADRLIDSLARADSASRAPRRTRA